MSDTDIIRRCDHCKWWEFPARRHFDASGKMLGVFSVCREAPTWVSTSSHHWCGRYEVAERVDSK